MNIQFVAIAKEIRKKPFKDEKLSKENERFKPWALKVVFGLFLKCFKSSVLNYPRYIYIKLFWSEQLFLQKSFARKTAVLVIVNPLLRNVVKWSDTL